MKRQLIQTVRRSGLDSVRVSAALREMAACQLEDVIELLRKRDWSDEHWTAYNSFLADVEQDMATARVLYEDAHVVRESA